MSGDPGSPRDGGLSIPPSSARNDDQAGPAPPRSAGAGTGHRRILEDTGKLTTSTGLSYLINLVGGFAIASILAPRLYGIWRTIQLALQYTAFSNFGLNLGLGKICPSLVSQGRVRLYQRLVGASLGFSLLIPALVDALLLVIAFDMEPGPARIGVIALIILLPLQQVYAHCDQALMIEKRFGIKARAMLGYTTSRVVLSILLALWLDLAGALLAFIVTLAGVCVYSVRRSRMGFNLTLTPPITRRLFSVSLPMAFVTIGELILTTADKWVVAGSLGSEAMGFYTMALFPLPVLTLIPVALRQVVSMEVYDRFGRSGKLADTEEVYQRSLFVLALASPLVIGAVYLGVPWMVDWLLPAYRPSLTAIKVHSILIYPMLLAATSYAVVVVMRKEKATFVRQAGVAALCSGISLAAVFAAKASFLTVLWIHGIGWLAFAAGLLYALQKSFGLDEDRAIAKTVKCFLPMAILAVELPLLSKGVEWAGLPPHTLLHASIGGLIHLGVCAPFLLLLEKRTRAISDGARMVARRLGLSE